jgi:UDP-N-acetylglucosamine 2-epimerase (non-hydrolysing)
VKILFVFGTRPEAVKLCPLAKVLRERGFDVGVCLSGQHRDLVRNVLDLFGIRPDYDLGIMTESQTPSGIMERVCAGLEGVIAGFHPDAAVVQGDTSTAAAAALCCFISRIPVFHVEAGLRSGNLYSPFPEEYNRRLITISSSLHFCPTRDAMKNLLGEGVPEENCFVTGNTGLDAFAFTERLGQTFELPDAAAGRKIILLTSHRREVRGERQLRMLLAVRRVLDTRSGCFAVIPVHPDPSLRALFGEVFGGCENAMLTPPLGLASMHSLVRRADLCVTDSGGLQEECAFAGTRCVVIRDVTERTEGIVAGLAVLAGTDPQRIETELVRALDAGCPRLPRSFIYGDGRASERIAEVLETRFGKQKHS